ncbi:hypothetical protein LR48_Vigan11g119000 [Vigna angularis]|uniref:DUF8039 domain-containing protein n=1 Tax=Phaseolus angularis TaxID=3914 RepID=A0A0L9VSV1_PHAAN|nr:hypothetical protein LR48_Vigan11g119000 [Vigna angularis]
MSQETLRQMDLQWDERLNQSMRSMEQQFVEQLQEQKQIQRALEEKLHSMTQGNMGADDTLTPPRVSTKGSCSAVDPTQYSGQYELLVDGDPPRIVAVGRVLEGGETIHGVAILPQHVCVTIDEVRDPQAQVPVPTPEINFVGEAIGSFIAWPRALIMSHIATPQFTRPQKQPIHDTVIHEDDDMAEAEDDPLSKLMTKLPRLKKAPLELYWDLRVFGLPPHVPVYITLSDALEMIGGDQMLNISIIQQWCMYMDTIVVDQGRSSMYGFVEPQTIQPSGNTLQNKQHYLQTWMDESKRDVYLVPCIEGKMKNDLRTMLQGGIGKSRGQLVQILYPKVCNQQLDSWECGFYVLCWIKTIIRVVIIDDWNERFKSTSPIPEDTIKQIRQEWTAYIMQRWS